MNDRKELNRQITDAIVEAERSLESCIEAWSNVRRLENDLIHHTDGLEREIAQRGEATAKLTVAVLRALLGRKNR